MSGFKRTVMRNQARHWLRVKNMTRRKGTLSHPERGSGRHLFSAAWRRVQQLDYRPVGSTVPNPYWDYRQQMRLGRRAKPDTVWGRIARLMRRALPPMPRGAR